MGLIRFVVMPTGLFVVAILAAAAHAVTPAVLIRSDLQSRSVMIQGMDDDKISYFDADRRLCVDPVRRVVQVRVKTDRPKQQPQEQVTPAMAPPPGSLGEIELVDGQRLTGHWVGADGPSQGLLWHHPMLGDLSVPLDEVYAVSPSGALPARAGPSVTQDQVELVNGDRLSGLVTAVSQQGVDLQSQDDGQPVTLPMDRIRTLTLANPTRDDRRGSALVWLTDGSRLLATSLRIASDQLTIVPVLADQGSPLTLPMDRVGRIDLAQGDGYLIDLAQLPVQVMGGGSVFGLAVPPRVEGASVFLHAPVTVSYSLPQGASRLSAELVLAVGSGPDELNEWADFVVVVGVDGQVIWRGRINASQPTATINKVLSGTRLTIELETADNGPILDRLLIQDAVVLVAPSTAGDAQPAGIAP